MNQHLANQVRLAQQHMQAQMQARVGQRQQQPVNVGQCGGPGGPWSCAPNLPPLSNAPQILARDCAPLGVRVQASAGGALTTATIAPAAGAFYVFGVRSFNSEDEITIQSIRTSGSTVAYNAGPFDAASYNTIDCWCGVNWDCITTTTPLQIQFNSIGSPSTPPFLNLTLFGRFVQGFNVCYPGFPNPFVPMPPSSAPSGF